MYTKTHGDDHPMKGCGNAEVRSWLNKRKAGQLYGIALIHQSIIYSWLSSHIRVPFRVGFSGASNSNIAPRTRDTECIVVGTLGKVCGENITPDQIR